MFVKSSQGGSKSPLPGVSFKTLAYGENTHLTLFSLTKGHKIPRHAHYQEQTGYLISGRMNFEIDGEVFTAEPGDAWNIAGNIEHGVDVLEDSLVIEVFSPVREDYLR